MTDDAGIANQSEVTFDLGHILMQNSIKLDLEKLLKSPKTTK